MVAVPFCRSEIKGREFVVAVLCSLIIISSCANPCQELAIFDFSRVRGDHSPPTTQLPQLQPPGFQCGDRPVEVLCSDGTFPSDIICDFGGLGGHSGWENLSGIQNIWMRYEVEDSRCTVKLLRVNGGGRFIFDSAVCVPEVVHDTVPPFRMADVQNMGLISDSSRCAQEYFILVATPKTEARGRNAGVRFTVQKYTCSASAEYPYFIIGREDKTTFKSDGRRNRPTS